MTIEFDDAKRVATLAARGLDMAHAREVSADAMLTVEDDWQDSGEDRFSIAVMKVLVWTLHAGASWIIGMRQANERERALYTPRF